MEFVGRERYMRMKNVDAMMHAYCGDARVRHREKKPTSMIRNVPSRINDMDLDAGDGFIEWDTLRTMKGFS